MECNKDEAIRARDIAERKLQNSDFAGAKRFAYKAQQLYTNLENIAMILAVCEVHMSAENKIGSEANWYDVLQIERVADEVSIKKQYRRLALLLHPDKNKYPGAEAAFKLIGEAHRILSDRITRIQFDLRAKAFAKISAPKLKPNLRATGGSSSSNKTQNAQDTIRNAANQQSSNVFHNGAEKFWTSCPHCKTSFEYYRSVVGRALSCQICKNGFIAYETHAPSSHSPASMSRSEVPNKKEIPCAVRPSQCNGVSHGYPAQSGKRVEPTNAGYADGSSKQKENNVEGVASVPKECGKGIKSDSMNPPVAKMSRNNNKKRDRPLVVESSESSGGTGQADVKDEVNQENGDYSKQEGGCGSRRSGRQNRNVSYKESQVDEDEFSSPVKKPKTVDNSNKKEAQSGRETDNGNISAASMDQTRGVKDAKQGGDVYPNNKRRLKKHSVDGLGDGEVDQSEEIVSEGNDYEKELNPVTMDCLEPEFSDFDKGKEKSCFDVDQIWAIYDTVDAMPRFYARVKRVMSPEFKLQITWLEPDPEEKSKKKWVKNELPAACGNFRHGSTEYTTDHLMFSHQMQFEKGEKRCTFVIYPRAGETWALFRNWDMNWINDPETHKPFKFEFVEILSDFDQSEGIEVACLKKLKGFVSLFQDVKKSQFRLPPSDLYRFSHRVPSFRMSGTERVGVPVGSYELDTASLPIDLDELDGDGKFGNGNKSVAGDGSHPSEMKTSSVRVETQKHHLDGKAGQSSTNVKNFKACSKDESGKEASNQDNDCIDMTPRKHATKNLGAQRFGLRRSPRDSLGKKSSNLNVT